MVETSILKLLFYLNCDLIDNTFINCVEMMQRM